MIRLRSKFLVCCYVALAGLVIFYLCTLHYFQKYGLEEPTEQEKRHRWSETKNILYWGGRWEVPDMDYGVGNAIFQHCPKYNNCYATYHRNTLPVERFDAIVFHGPEYHHLFHGYPDKRDPKQVYILLDHEYPGNYIIGYDNFYNWTWTYRHDSDIVEPYFVFDKRETNYTAPTTQDVDRKNNMIAWFVSHCPTPGRREDIYKKLNQYIPVDVYGRCGDKTCSKDDSESCYRMIEKNYKFYLSFENSDCKDYVTEKFFYIYWYNIIPIVYGGADYSKIAPEKSYINVKDFKSISDLADYLNHLSTNTEEYLAYFEWKKHYTMESPRNAVLCDLCQQLNERTDTKIIGNLKEWWRGKDDDICSTKFVDSLS